MSSCYSFYYQLKNNNPSDTAIALNYFAEVPVDLLSSTGFSMNEYFGHIPLLLLMNHVFLSPTVSSKYTDLQSHFRSVNDTAFIRRRNTFK